MLKTAPKQYTKEYPRPFDFRAYYLTRERSRVRDDEPKPSDKIGSWLAPKLAGNLAGPLEEPGSFSVYSSATKRYLVKGSAAVHARFKADLETLIADRQRRLQELKAKEQEQNASRLSKTP